MRSFPKSDCNKFMGKILNAKIKEKKFIDKKIATLATKGELKADQNKIVKIQMFNSSYLCGKIHFEDDGTQNYLSV